MCILAGVDAAAEAALAFTTLKPHQPPELTAGAAAEAPACAPDCGIPKLPKLADEAAGTEVAAAEPALPLPVRSGHYLCVLIKISHTAWS